MSVLFDFINSLRGLSIGILLPTVFLLGVLSTPHCLGMCGVLCFSNCSTKQRVTQYQLGRLLSYLTVGLFFSVLGTGFYVQSSKNIYWFLFFLVVLIISISSLKHFGRLLNSFTFRFFKKLNPGSLAFVTGLISGLLPCGVLHFIFGLAALNSHLFAGLAVVFCFWFGTLPGFYWGAYFGQRLLKMNSRRLQMALIGVCFFYAIVVYGYRASLKAPGQDTVATDLSCHSLFSEESTREQP